MLKVWIFIINYIIYNVNSHFILNNLTNSFLNELNNNKLNVESTTLNSNIIINESLINTNKTFKKSFDKLILVQAVTKKELFLVL